MNTRHKWKLAVVFLITSLLAAFCFILPAHHVYAPEQTQLGKAEIFTAEERLILSALHCNYPEESFTPSQIGKPSTRIHINIVAKEGTYWAVETAANFRAIFVNIDNNAGNSVDIYDERVFRKEDYIANNSASKRCISIWLISPLGEYDLVWYDPDFRLDDLQLQEGIAVHLNPKPSP